MKRAKEDWKFAFEPTWELKELINTSFNAHDFKEKKPHVDGDLWAVNHFKVEDKVWAVKQLKRGKGWELNEIVINAELTQGKDEYFVKFFGWNEDANFTYIAMEYIELGDLGNHLNPPWIEEDIKIAIRQVLQGLEYMHARSIMHRDLKPQNIFLVQRSPPFVKIGNFAISTLPGSSTSSEVVGTRPYMAPDIIAGEPYTPAVDLWSLGCVIYTMMKGTLLFTDVHEAYVLLRYDELWRNHLKEKLEGMSEGVTEIMRQLIVKDANSRLTATGALQHHWFTSLKTETFTNQSNKSKS